MLTVVRSAVTIINAAIAAGEKSCWCFSQPMPQGVLEMLPAEARGIACVCRTCAMSHNALERALDQMAEVLRRR